MCTPCSFFMCLHVSKPLSSHLQLASSTRPWTLLPLTQSLILPHSHFTLHWRKASTSDSIALSITSSLLSSMYIAHFLCGSYSELLHIPWSWFYCRFYILFKFKDNCCRNCFLFMFSYNVYCYAPKDQDKFLVRVNLLGNKPDSDSDCLTLATDCLLSGLATQKQA